MFREPRKELRANHAQTDCAFREEDSNAFCHERWIRCGLLGEKGQSVLQYTVE